MPSDQRFTANSPSVVSEDIDGEVMILHLASGIYYSAENIGASLWGWMEAGRSVVEMVEHLTEQHGDDDPELIASSVHAFFEKLQECELIVEDDKPAVDEEALPTNGAAPARFEAPVLGCYDDMEDLLLLDPIHQVDKAAGWPTPKDSARPRD